MRVADLTGVALDEWVARARGEAPGAAYSSDWSHGGPIIERERIGIAAQDVDGTWSGYLFDHAAGCMSFDCEGPTALIAAMRAYVTSTFGEDVPAAGPGETTQ